MRWTLRCGRGSAFAILALAATSGCSNSDVKVPPKVELSDLKVSFSGTRNATASVHYRFVQGRARPGKWYKVKLSITAEGNNRGFDLYSGDASGLSTEGTLNKECTIDPPGMAWKSGETVKYRIVCYEGASKDAPEFKGISNAPDGQGQIP
jgi:hypothetical protein